MARELAPANIVVNAIAPGYTVTDSVAANPAQHDVLGTMVTPVSSLILRSESTL